MTFTIERLDNNMQVYIYELDTGLDLPHALSHIWSLSEFIKKFPSVPYKSNINSVSCEPERGLFHVGYSDGTIQSYPSFLGHPILEWVISNYDAIYQSALAEVKAAIALADNGVEPPIL